MTRFSLALAAYVAGGILTYGVLYNESYDRARASYPTLGESVWRANANFEAGMPSFVWPVTWAGRGAIWLTSRRPS